MNKDAAIKVQAAAPVKLPKSYSIELVHTTQLKMNTEMVEITLA